MREHLAFEVMLYTGFRRGDASRFGRQHVQSGLIYMTTEKGQGKASVVLPLLPPPAGSIETAKTSGMAFIARVDGTAMGKEGVGNWFADAGMSADVPRREPNPTCLGGRRTPDSGTEIGRLLPHLIVGYGRRGEKEGKSSS